MVSRVTTESKHSFVRQEEQAKQKPKISGLSFCFDAL